jgi:hypothetical protein
MSTLPIILGGGALAALLLSRERAREAAILTKHQPDERLLDGFVWPVPAWKGRQPVISDGFHSMRGERRHNGVDILFKRLPTDTFRPGSPNGSRMFVMPDGIEAIAAADGELWSALWTSHGFAVVIDHKPLPFSTFYTHLERLLVPPTSPGTKTKRKIRAGEPLGIIGYSPLDAAKLKHLHFALWRGGPKDPIDPAPEMKKWRVVGAQLRNGRFLYRPVGASHEPYPQWVRDLKGESGVYIIRERSSREVVYVGSSVGRLYDTLTRHFQIWRRWKGFWRGQYGEGHDPGLTYERDSVEVAVRITRASDALDEESRLIQRLRPRDNLTGVPALEEAPF